MTSLNRVWNHSAVLCSISHCRLLWCFIHLRTLYFFLKLFKTVFSFFSNKSSRCLIFAKANISYVLVCSINFLMFSIPLSAFLLIFWSSPLKHISIDKWFLCFGININNRNMFLVEWLANLYYRTILYLQHMMQINRLVIKTNRCCFCFHFFNICTPYFFILYYPEKNSVRIKQISLC